MAKAKSVHEKLIAKVKVHKGVLAAAAIRLEELHQKVEQRTDGWTAEIRRSLEDEMRRTRYHPRV